MLNFICNLIYKLSALAPMLFVFSMSLLYRESYYYIAICVMVILLLICLVFMVSFSHLMKKISIIEIKVTRITPYDDWIIGYVISNVFPLVSLAINDLNMNVLFIVMLILISTIAITNYPIPNVFLLIRKYHFYRIETENGISDYLLISKRKIRKASDINQVKRIFEYLLLDSEEE
ncbi:MAG: hypothetical protein ACOX1M_01450 [Erysipelotrichaceae bacterium]